MRRQRIKLEALGNTADACFAVNAERRITTWNDGAVRLFGYGAAEVLGRPCSTVVRGLRRSGRRLCSERCPVFRRAQAGKLIRDYDLFARNRDGCQLLVNVGFVVLPEGGTGLILVHYARHVQRSTAGQETLARTAVGAGPDGRWRDLTRREEEILSLLARGMGTGEVARKLDISPATVRNHVQAMMGKLGVHGRLAAVAAYARHRQTVAAPR